MEWFSKNPTITIIAIIVAVVILIAIAGGLYWYFTKENFKTPDEEGEVDYRMPSV